MFSRVPVRLFLFYTKESLRLTPSLPNSKGMVGIAAPNPHSDWIAEFSFTASGKGYMGGEGLAFWYTKDAMVEGPILGSKDHFTGLGLLFNTADQEEHRFTPVIHAVQNDGTQEFKFLHETEYEHRSLGSCFRDYRNTPGVVWVRVTYHKQELEVELDIRQDGYGIPGLWYNSTGYTKCMEKKDVKLPTGYHFSLSAQTGEHLADDHDIHSLEIYNLNPSARTQYAISF
jgi:hypothetical protein